LPFYRYEIKIKRKTKKGGSEDGKREKRWKKESEGEKRWQRKRKVS